MISVQSETKHTNPFTAPSTNGTGNLSPVSRGSFLIFLFVVFGLFFSGLLFAQNVGDYRTSANATFTASAGWERWNGGAWASPVPPPIASAGQITIRNTHTARVNTDISLDQLRVEAGGILIVNLTNTLTVINGPSTDLTVIGTVNVQGTMDVNGSVANSGSINSSGTINFNAGSSYTHARNGGSIPNANWDVTSDCNVTGVTNVSAGISGFNQTFGNFTWNCPGQNGNFYMESDIQIAGDFTVSNTGGSDPVTHALRMSNTPAVGYTMTVNGDVIIENVASFKMNNNSGSCFVNVDGDFYLNGGHFCIVTGPASSTLSVIGDVTVAGGTMIMQEDNNPATIATWNIGGNLTFNSGTISVYGTGTGEINIGSDFTFNGGTLTESSTGIVEINFNGGTTQTFLRTGGTIQNTINFSVISGSTLDLGTSLIDGSSGTFDLDAGCGIITAHPQGLSSSAGTGSIQVLGTKTFSTGADYTYDGSAAQVTGNALPSSVNNLTIDNASGVSLTGGSSVNSALNLVNGNFSLLTNDFIINPPALINGASASRYIVADVSGTLIQQVDGSSIVFPVGTSGSYLPITLNNSGTSDNFGIWVFADVLESGTSGASITEIADCVNATWDISEGTGGGSDLSITAQWNGSDEGASFNGGSCGLGYYNGSAWSAQTTSGSAAGSDPYTRNRSGVTEVGSFAVGSYCTRMYDDTAPTITCPGNLAAECDISEQPVYADYAAFVTAGGSASDVCGLNTSSFTHVSDVTDGLSCPETITRTYRISDNAGNSATCQQLIVIDPTTAPAEVGGPVSVSSTVDCAADTVPPTLPVVNDACGNLLIPAAPEMSGTYVDCEGTVIYTYTYTDCTGLTFVWSYTYTIDIPDFTMPADGSSTVDCLVDAQVQPAAPAVNDFCGNAITPTLVTTPADIACEGDMVWVYNYTDCAGNSHDWSYTYTIDIPDFTMPADGSSTVACFTDAQIQPATPAVNDFCGNAITPTLVTTPADIACEGDMVWVFNYTDCAGNSHDWNYTYHVKDSIPPVIIPKQNISIALSAINGIYVLGASDVDSLSFDQCNDINSMYLDRDTLTCEDLGLIPVKIYAVDDCGNVDSLTVDITVYYEIEPDPQITYDSVICDGGILEIGLENPFDNMKFVWTVSSNPFITGGYTSPDSITNGPYPFTIQDTLYNSSNSVQSVVYNIEAHPWSGTVYDNLACPADFDTSFTVYVNPTPGIDVSAPDTVLCNGETATITVSSPNATLRGDWMYDLVVTADPEIDGESGDQTGVTTASYTETLTNNDTIVHKVEYHFIPRIVPDDMGADCENGRDTIITIWVNPTPEIRVVASDSVLCNGETTILTITNPNNPIRGNWIYDLVVTADSEIGGESGDQTGVITPFFSETLTNSDTIVHKVEYHFTPRITPDDFGLECGNPRDTIITIWVNPSPAIRVNADTVICDGETAVINIGNPNNPIRGNWRYDLAVTAEPEIDGEMLSDVDLDVSTINETLTNNDTVVHYVDYTFTPKIFNDDGAAVACFNGDTTIRIWVNPTPRISVNASDSVLCDGATTILTVRNPNIPIRGTWMYDLEVIADSDIDGESLDQTGITTASFTETLTNSDTVVHRVWYRFIPRIAPDDMGAECPNLRDTTIVIWVNPTPKIRVSSDTVICTGETVDISIRNPNDPIYGAWRYDLDVFAEPEIGGERASDIDLAFVTISETLTNSDSVAHYVDYTFTPKIYNHGGLVPPCINGDTTIRIWVNPTPQIRVSADTVLCNGETSTIVVRNPNDMVQGTWVYDLVVTAEDEIDGARASENDLSLTTIPETLTNSDTVVHFVTYHFTPRVIPGNGHPDCGSGRDTTITIWVNPTPEIRVVADTVICTGETASISVRNPNNPIRGTWRYDMVVTADPEISGASGDQVGVTTPSYFETLTNSDTVKHKVEYLFTPWIHPDDFGADCGASQDTLITIWVNPTPSIAVTAPDTVLCTDEDVSFNIRNPNHDIEGDWKYNLDVDYGDHISGMIIDGEYDATVTNLMDHLENSDTVAHAVSYHFTPRITPNDGGLDCGGGLDTTIWIWVNPTPEIRVSIPDTVICNEDFVNLFVRNPNIPVMGDWKYNLTVDYGPYITGIGIDGDYDATDLFLTDQLTNPDTMYHFVEYTFTPRISPVDLDPDCENGIATTIRVWVNPTPAIRVRAQDSILCNGEPAIIEIANPNAFLNGYWEYNLVVNPDPEISGARSSVDGIIDTLLIDPLINNDTIVHKVEYTFTPTKTPDPDICAGGNDTTIIIWVNPTPEVRVWVSDTVLCDGDEVSLELRNPNVSVHGDWLGTLEILPDPGITGILGISEPFTGDASYGPYTLGNTANEAQSVTFIFTPDIRDTYDGLCNNGIADTIVVWVNPVPDINVVPTDTLICNDEMAEFKVSSLNPSVRGNWYYALDVVPDAEILGARGNSIYPLDSILIQDVLTNTDTVAHKVVYHFIPRIGPSDFQGDCQNGRDTIITIWVNPSPRIFVDFPDTIFCNNDTAVISVVDGLGFVYGDKVYDLTAIYDPSNVTVISRDSGDTEIVDPIAPITDIYVNHTLQAQWVDYIFTPRILDARLPDHQGEFCPGEDIEVRIWINPTPGIGVDVPDTIICDNDNVIINVYTSLGSVMGGSVVYDLDVTYDASAVSGSITGDGEWDSSQSINDLLVNDTNNVQLISYRFTARIRDDRAGHEGSFCNNGSDTTIYIYLNPTPVLDYTLLEDSLCYDDGFTIITDSAVSATHPLYFELVVTNDNNLSGVIDPGVYGDTLAVANHLDQTGVMNPHTGYGRLTYNILPFISTEGCLGTDTTFIVDVNPLPRMTAQLSRPQDTAVCYDQGYLILMGENIDSTTGSFVYELDTYGYTDLNVDNERTDGDYTIENLDQTTVINNGEFIEDITYRYIPMIRNVNGQGKDCPGTDYDSITVQVAPELRGVLEPDTSYVGGHIVRCYGEEVNSLHPNVRGGYYRNPYVFDWETIVGTGVVQADSVQTNMGAGQYWFEVEDIIGCYFADTITLTQPDTLEVADHTIVAATCSLTPATALGSIDISPAGGIEGYAYDWDGPYGYTGTEQDVIGPGGSYLLELRDTNQCIYTTNYWIDYASAITMSATETRYGNYEITCNGDSTGEIFVNSIVGGFPVYNLLAIEETSGDTLYNEIITESGGFYSATIGNLPQGEYRLWAFDTTGCWNEEAQTITYLLEEPDPITVSRDSADIQFHSDTVDISCFGADDGFINLVVNGGHTADYENDYIWSGPDDLVQGDSLQSSLSGGTYNVTVRDFWLCEESAEFTLFEPAQIVMNIDSIRNFNGWNVSCFGRDDGFIEISSSGGIGSHGYYWDRVSSPLPNPTDQDIYDLIADTYGLTITDSIGCPLDTSFELIQPNPLGLIDSIPSRNTFEIFCADDSTGLINLTPLGGADSLLNTYAWETDTGYLADTTSMNQSGLPAGTYRVYVTDINECKFDTAYVLDEPEPLVIDTLIADSAYCHGSASGSINLYASGGVPVYRYDWSNGEETEDIDSLFAGVYTIEITDLNGCSIDSSAEVFEADHFNVDLMVASDYNGAVISCANFSDGAIYVDTSNAGGTKPYSYQWNTGATSQDLEGLPAGSYRVVVVDVHGCVDSAQVVLDDPLPIQYNIDAKNPLCFGDSTGQIDLLLTGGTVYSLDDYDVWVNEQLSGPYVSNLPAGFYQIRIEDLNDCFVETDAELFNNPLLELSFDTEDAFCPEKADGEMTLYIDGGSGGYWTTWSGDLPDDEHYFNEIKAGEYIATVIDANECVVTDTAVVGYTYESCLVIPNAFSPNGDGFNDMWMIEGIELYDDVELRIFDRWGSRVYYTPNAEGDPWDGSFDGRYLPIDSYHYVIDLNNGEPAITGNVTIVR